MAKEWEVRTHGDPLGTVQQFIKAVWNRAGLAGMLVPINGNPEAVTRPRLIDDPALLGEVNPFKPVMTMNAARLVPEILQEHAGRQLAGLLRPCEMRALREMVKHDGFQLDGFLTICVDCLGTLPLDEYKWRAARKESRSNLTQEALQFARQGGINAYRYRSACQTCSSTEASGADLNIHVLGLPVRQHILVGAKDEAAAQRLDLAALSDGPADASLVDQHEHIIARLNERHQRTMERVSQSLADLLPQNVEALMAQLVSCGACQRCMEVCPICSVNFPLRDADNRLQREQVIHWLISCAGCGMCEQACTNHLPLSTIFGHIRQVLIEEYQYTPEADLPAIH